MESKGKIGIIHTNSGKTWNVPLEFAQDCQMHIIERMKEDKPVQEFFICYNAEDEILSIRAKSIEAVEIVDPARIEKEHIDANECPVCYEQFEDKIELQIHIANKHKDFKFSGGE